MRVLLVQSPEEKAAAESGGGIAAGGVRILVGHTEAAKQAVVLGDPMIDSYIALVGIVRFYRIAQIVVRHARCGHRTRHVGGGIKAISFCDAGSKRLVGI